MSSIAIVAAFFLSAIADQSLDSCDEERRVGPFEINSFLNDGGGAIIAISYSIPRHHVSPRPPAPWTNAPSIDLEYRVPLSHERYRSLRLSGLDRLFPDPRFTIRAMTMRCGRDVNLIGDVARQPFPLTGVFVRESYLRSDACIVGLRRFGSYRLSFEEQQGDARFVRIEGRADFAAAMRQGEQMVRRGLARARSGRCRPNPPPIPPT